MVKSVLSVYHRGLRDWIIQRLSAIIMAIYSIALIVYIVFNPGLSFESWHGLFAHQWVKIATILMLLSMLGHAWVGIWTVFTDYIKCSVLRAFLNTLVLLSLFAFFIWGIMILWSL